MEDNENGIVVDINNEPWIDSFNYYSPFEIIKI